MRATNPMPDETRQEVVRSHLKPSLDSTRKLRAKLFRPQASQLDVRNVPQALPGPVLIENRKDEAKALKSVASGDGLLPSALASAAAERTESSSRITSQPGVTNRCHLRIVLHHQPAATLAH